MALVRERNGRLMIEGDMSCDGLDAWARQMLRLAAREGDMVLDLAAVEHCDSAAVALLVACRQAKLRQHDRLRLVNVPPRLAMLFSVYELDRVFAGD